MKTDYIIKEVSTNKKFHIVTTTTSVGFYIPVKYGVEPKVGDNVTVYGALGKTIQGIDLNRRTIFYKTDQCLELEREEWLANYKQEQLESFEANKGRLDADFDELPKAFQERITRFREEDPDFRVESEAYEMFCCTEAVKIATYCKTPEAVVDFKEEPWEKQKEAGVDSGHTGNTFGAACNLAFNYLNKAKL